MYLLIQQLEDHIFTPRVLGHAVRLSSLVIMVSIVVGFEIAGILGAVIAVPVVASGRELLSYLYAKILKQDPYPPDVAADKDQAEASGDSTAQAAAV